MATALQLLLALVWATSVAVVWRGTRERRLGWVLVSVVLGPLAVVALLARRRAEGYRTRTTPEQQAEDAELLAAIARAGDTATAARQLGISEAELRRRGLAAVDRSAMRPSE